MIEIMALQLEQLTREQQPEQVRQNLEEETRLNLKERDDCYERNQNRQELNLKIIQRNQENQMVYQDSKFLNDEGDLVRRCQGEESSASSMGKLIQNNHHMTTK